MTADSDAASGAPSAGRSPGQIVLAGAPLGNPADASLRLAEALRTADVIAAEDTRRLKRLAADLGIRIEAQLVSFHDHNEQERTPGLIAAAAGGASVVLITDAGMPSVSDPGYRLVAAAVDAGIALTCLPGPSAVTAALALSGLPSARFCFEGFLSRRPGERRRQLAELAQERRTIVLFEAPHRLAALLEAMAEAFGSQRPAAVCREISKTYEEVRRGTIGELIEWAAEPVRGEITVVVGGYDDTHSAVTDAELAERVQAEVERGRSKRDAIELVATLSAVPRRRVFDAFHRPAQG